MPTMHHRAQVNPVRVLDHPEHRTVRIQYKNYRDTRRRQIQHNYVVLRTTLVDSGELQNCIFWRKRTETGSKLAARQWFLGTHEVH
jgi:hypothetical protein